MYKVIGKADTPINKPVLINEKEPEPEGLIKKLFGIVRIKSLFGKNPENTCIKLEPLLKILIGIFVS